MLDIIKQLAADAVDLGRAADFCMGTVVSGSPLRIRLEEGLELTEPFLILAEPVTNWQETGTVWLCTSTIYTTTGGWRRANALQ